MIPSWFLLQVRWFFSGEPVVSPDYQIHQFGDNYSLFIPEVFDEDAGRFSVSAENESGKATCAALLVVVDESAAPPKPPSPPVVSVQHVYLHFNISRQSFIILLYVLIYHNQSCEKFIPVHCSDMVVYMFMLGYVVLYIQMIPQNN